MITESFSLEGMEGGFLPIEVDPLYGAEVGVLQKTTLVFECSGGAMDGGGD